MILQHFWKYHKKDGLPGSTNAFFEDHCTLVQGLICAQMIWSMLANAFLTGFMFAVLSKSENRSGTFAMFLLSSKKKVLNCRHNLFFVLPSLFFVRLHAARSHKYSLLFTKSTNRLFEQTNYQCY